MRLLKAVGIVTIGTLIVFLLGLIIFEVLIHSLPFVVPILIFLFIFSMVVYFVYESLEG